MTALIFTKRVSRNGTYTIECAYHNGIKWYSEFFNFKKGKLTYGSAMDFNRLCSTFELPRKIRTEILNLKLNESTSLENVPQFIVKTDAKGFMKYFGEEIDV